MKKAPLKIVSRTRAPDDQNRVGKRKATHLETRAIDPIVKTNVSIPANILRQFENAMKSGRWLITVLRVENEKLFLDRTAMNFPTADLDLAIRLIVENLQSLKDGTHR